MEKAFFSTPELAELLGVFHTTVRRWIERNQIKGFRVGRNYKIPAAEVMRMLDQHGLPLPDILRERPDGLLSPEELHPHDLDASGSILQRLLVVDQIPDPAIVCRTDTVLGANQAFALLTGYDQADIIGLKIHAFFDPSSCRTLLDKASLAVSEEQPVAPTTCAAVLRPKHGPPKSTTIELRPLAGLTGVVVFIVRSGETSTKDLKKQLGDHKNMD
ncbi:MAG: excisionase family DNA-binding protein [Deltaproteobacteria bacterium]|nr:excisionase family DNA-binding protein [Deltaproteobacteria bacterium]